MFTGAPRAGRLRRLPLIVAAALAASLVPGAALADEPLPWPIPGSPPLPPDYTVEYLPAVDRVYCKGGELRCVYDLERTLADLTGQLGCDHDAVFAAAYLIITRGYIESAITPDYFDRIDQIGAISPPSAGPTTTGSVTSCGRTRNT